MLRQRENGICLIEVLIACAISGIVFAGAFQLLYRAAQSFNRAQIQQSSYLDEFRLNAAMLHETLCGETHGLIGVTILHCTKPAGGQHAPLTASILLNTHD